MAAQQTLVDIPYINEKAIHKTYDNGYQVVFVPKRGDVFNINTWVKTGSIHENDVNNGVSHFLEHLMFKGTERFKPGEFDKAMEGMGAIINAATWKDFTFYYITGPKGEEGQNFEKALDMHADMLLFSTLPPEEIGETFDVTDPNTTANKRERGVVIEEIGMRGDSPWTKVFNKLNAMMYTPEHPYYRDVIGTREIIATIPREEIERYYQTWYSPKNITTIVVGDFDFDWLEERILKCFDFSKQPQSEQPGPMPKDSFPPMISTEAMFAEIKEDYQTSFFLSGFHGPSPDDLKNSIAIDVASRVLGEGRNSRLHQALIEDPKEPVFNTISSGQNNFKLGNVLYLQGNYNSTDAKGCLADVNKVVHEFVHEKPVTQEEFDRAIKKLKVDFAETSETASGIAEALGESVTSTDSLDSYNRYLEVLASLNLNDVHTAAKQWIDLDKCYTCVLSPKGSA